MSVLGPSFDGRTRFGVRLLHESTKSFLVHFLFSHQSLRTTETPLQHSCGFQEVLRRCSTGPAGGRYLSSFHPRPCSRQQCCSSQHSLCGRVLHTCGEGQTRARAGFIATMEMETRIWETCFRFHCYGNEPHLRLLSSPISLIDRYY